LDASRTHVQRPPRRDQTLADTTDVDLAFSGEIHSAARGPLFAFFSGGLAARKCPSWRTSNNFVRGKASTQQRRQPRLSNPIRSLALFVKGAPDAGISSTGFRQDRWGGGGLPPGAVERLQGFKRSDRPGYDLRGVDAGAVEELSGKGGKKKKKTKSQAGFRPAQAIRRLARGPGLAGHPRKSNSLSRKREPRLPRQAVSDLYRFCSGAPPPNQIHVPRLRERINDSVPLLDRERRRSTT